MSSREEWVNSLAVGDEVAFASMRSNRITIHTVERITKTWIVLDSKARFSAMDGRMRAGNPSHYIEPVTDAAVEQVKGRHLTKKLAQMDLTKLPTSKLERILAIIEEK